MKATASYLNDNKKAGRITVCSITYFHSVIISNHPILLHKSLKLNFPVYFHEEKSFKPLSSSYRVLNFEFKICFIYSHTYLQMHLCLQIIFSSNSGTYTCYTLGEHKWEHVMKCLEPPRKNTFTVFPTVFSFQHEKNRRKKEMKEKSAIYWVSTSYLWCTGHSTPLYSTLQFI